MGPFEGKDSGKTMPLLIKMTKFIAAASKGDYNDGGRDNGFSDLTLESVRLSCGVPSIGVYLITIGF